MSRSENWKNLLIAKSFSMIFVSALESNLRCLLCITTFAFEWIIIEFSRVVMTKGKKSSPYWVRKKGDAFQLMT